MEPLNYYETESVSAPYNLAMEEAMAEEAGRSGHGAFMLWQNSPSVIIGRHQNAFSEVNLAELTRRNIPLVRRLTGGGAVYHDLGNLNFTFLIPHTDASETGVGELLAPLLGYLRSLGLEAEMAGRNDISLKGGGKFSGLAGRRTPGCCQVHGTIMYDVDLRVLGEILLVDPAKFKGKGVASVRARVANLKPLLPLGLEEFWRGVREAYTPRPGRIPKAVKARAEALAEEKYARDEWNVGQSPRADIFIKHRFPFGSLELHLSIEKNAIIDACITGDFLTKANSGAQIPIESLEGALRGLPADQPGKWAEAWARLDLRTVFYGRVDQSVVVNWLAASI